MYFFSIKEITPDVTFKVLLQFDKAINPTLAFWVKKKTTIKLVFLIVMVNTPYLFNPLWGG